MKLSDPAIAARIAATAQGYSDAARRLGMTVSEDKRVSERDMAILLGRSPGGLKAARLKGAGPVFFNLPVGGSKVSYRLSDVALWIERNRVANVSERV